MKRLMLVAVMMAAYGSAVADISSTSVSGSAAQSQAGAIAGSTAITGPSNATNGAATAGNAQTLSVTSPGTVNYGGEYKVKNVPDVTTIVPAMTAPCMISTGISGAGAGFGFGVASGLEDKNCTAREDARTLVALGLVSEAIARLCQREDMAKAMGPKCGVPTQLPANAPQVSYNPTTRTTTVRELNGFNH